MDRDDIIRMAREAGMIGTGEAGNELERLYREAILDALPRFAYLIAAAEREACAKVCEEYQDAVDRHRWPNGYECADAIRARGQG